MYVKESDSQEVQLVAYSRVFMCDRWQNWRTWHVQTTGVQMFPSQVQMWNYRVWCVAYWYGFGFESIFS